jgi:hypothetical protein
VIGRSARREGLFSGGKAAEGALEVGRRSVSPYEEAEDD